MSSDSYWSTVNEMLQANKIDFNKPSAKLNDTTASDLTLCALTFEVGDSLKSGIQYALNNFEVISKLEYNFNDGQPTKTTLKQLEWAKVFIDSKQKAEYHDVTILNAQHYVPIGEFLLKCHLLAQRNPNEFKILTDVKRKTLIVQLFGAEYTEEVILMPESKTKESTISCSQVIFDSADVESAIDELIMNQLDRTWSPWRIQTVYVQESLRNEIENILTPERLNATSNTITTKSSANYERQNEALAKQFGGKLLSSDNKMVYYLFDVPVKYLPKPTNASFSHIPVAVNFFRTAKEAIQLMKTDCDPTKRNLTSVWTGNIQLFYELAGDLNSDIVWSNCLGVFDAAMPSLVEEFDFKGSLSVDSTINTKGKYAVHTITPASGKQKFLYISYGTTFAN